MKGTGCDVSSLKSEQEKVTAASKMKSFFYLDWYLMKRTIIGKFWHKIKSARLVKQ